MVDRMRNRTESDLVKRPAIVKRLNLDYFQGEDALTYKSIHQVNHTGGLVFKWASALTARATDVMNRGLHHELDYKTKLHNQQVAHENYHHYDPNQKFHYYNHTPHNQAMGIQGPPPVGLSHVNYHRAQLAPLDVYSDQLVQSFEQMRLLQLRDRAIAEGVDLMKLDEAADADDPKRAIIELLVDVLRKPQEPDPEIIVEGWLKKRSKKEGKEWRLRHTVLYSNHMLKYYKEAFEIDKGQIEIHQYMLVRKFEDETASEEAKDMLSQHPFGFEVYCTTAKRSWFFDACTSDKQAVWMKVLEHQIDRLFSESLYDGTPAPAGPVSAAGMFDDYGHPFQVPEAAHTPALHAQNGHWVASGAHDPNLNPMGAWAQLMNPFMSQEIDPSAWESYHEDPTPASQAQWAGLWEARHAAYKHAHVEQPPPRRVTEWTC